RSDRRRIGDVQFGSVEPFATQTARFQTCKHDTVRKKRALDRNGVAMREYQIFEVADHESPVIVEVELDVETGGEGLGPPLDPRGKQEVVSIRIEMQDRSLESIPVLN